MSPNIRYQTELSEYDLRLWLIMALSFGLMFIIQATAPELAPLIYHRFYRVPMQLMVILSPLIPLVSLIALFASRLLLFSGRIHHILRALLVGILVAIVAAARLTLGYNIINWAAALVLGALAVLVALVVFVYDILPLSHFVKSFGPFCIIGVVMYCLVRLVALLLHDQFGTSIPMLVIESILGVVFYVLALWYWSAKTNNGEFAELFPRATHIPQIFRTMSLTDAYMANQETKHFAIRAWLEQSYHGPVCDPWVGKLDERQRKMVASGITYAVYAIWSFFAILYSSFFASSIPFIPITFVCIMMLIVAEFIAAGRNKDIIIQNAIILAFIIFMMCMFIESIGWGGAVVIFAFYARNYRLDDFARMALLTIAVGLTLVVVSSRAGIIPALIETGGRVRHLLGFLGALYPPMFGFIITMLTIYLSKHNFGFSKAGALVLVNFFLYIYTDSRLSFYLSAIVIVAALILSWCGRRGISAHMPTRVLSSIFIVCFVVSIIVTLAYDSTNATWAALNDIVGRRLSLAHDGLMRYGITFFGQDVADLGNGLNIDGVCETLSDEEYDYIDNAYVKLLVRWGVVWTAVYLVIWTASIHFAAKINDPYLVCCLVIIALHCLIDDLTLSLVYNPFFLVAGFAIVWIVSNWRSKKESHA